MVQAQIIWNAKFSKLTAGVQSTKWHVWHGKLLLLLTLNELKIVPIKYLKLRKKFSRHTKSVKGAENRTVASWDSVEGVVREEEEEGNPQFGGDSGPQGTCCSSRGEQSYEPYRALGEGVGDSKDDGCSRNGF